MKASYDKNSAVVVLPPVGGGRLRDPKLRAWLAKSDLHRDGQPREMLAHVLGELNLPYPDEGLAALRMWGQTGDRPAVWIAAADPVYLEPRLDRLCLHALRRRGVEPSELGSLIDHLQSTLSEGTDFGFARLGSYGYLRSDHAIATAAVPAYVVDGQAPDEHLPGGRGADEHRRLISEVEMALHDHEVNLLRAGQDRPLINSLWLWGGGRAPEKITRSQPPLFSDDPLLTGYWESATAVSELWPGSIDDCIDTSADGFVAVTPEFEDGPELLEACLGQLRQALRSGRLSRLVLHFRDGIRAEVLRSHAVRFWKRNSVLLS